MRAASTWAPRKPRIEPVSLSVGPNDQTAFEARNSVSSALLAMP